MKGSDDYIPWPDEDWLGPIEPLCWSVGPHIPIPRWPEPDLGEGGDG